ncbi:VOC family protein [Brucellaceae bacterium C25G]
MSNGIHHVTLITGKVQPNVDFYAGFLGLRLVKQTAGYEDTDQLHLFYGDQHGNPGSLVSFLVWEDGVRGRAGHGQISEIAFAIDHSAIGFWLERGLRQHIAIEGPKVEMGETTLRLKDPDGVIVKLVASSLKSPNAAVSADIPAFAAVQRLQGVTILSDVPEQTQAFLTQHFGLKADIQEGTISRLVSQSGDYLDVRDATGFWEAMQGTGTVDHVALRADSLADIEAISAEFTKLNAVETTVHDRKYFHSLYVREPGGSLIEYATDAPGMDVDEDVADLGQTLFVPEASQAQLDDIRLRLPQFSLPGEERIVYRELPFIHRIYQPQEPDGSFFVLLHGSGGTENDLMPLSHKIAPHATLIGVRGRSTEEGDHRWFRRITMSRFDQGDIAFEAEAFAAFVEGLIQSYQLDLSKTVFLGYSNGANLLGAVMRLHPHLLQKVILLRGGEVLEAAPVADLSDVAVLMLNGKDDIYGGFAKPLSEALLAGKAELDAQMLQAGHSLVEADVILSAQWLETK